MREKLIGFAKLAAVIVVVALVWQFGVKPRMTRYQAWEGRIRDTYQVRDMKRQASSTHDAEWKLFRYRLRVDLNSDEEIDVEVPYGLWKNVAPGVRLVKVSGERWPQPQTFTDEDRAHEYFQAYLEATKQEEEAVSLGLTEEELAAQKEYLVAKAGEEGVVKRPSGLLYRVVEEGEGESPRSEDKVRVAYKGMLIDGDVFDANEDMTFPVGNVIPGWQEALQLMKPGATWEVFIPSKLAYGKQAPQRIGPDKTLVFEVTLHEVVDE
ncbi:MAG: hypothetical protein GY851_11330 [bacterium]|nr:hypothetical protein [bacterium]